MLSKRNFGSLMTVDAQGDVTDYVDGFKRLDACRAHYASVGMPDSYIEGLIR